MFSVAGRMILAVCSFLRKDIEQFKFTKTNKKCILYRIKSNRKSQRSQCLGEQDV